ncbi:MAG TPA: ROK family protein [Polyangiaceae bacterium]|nr:ROK family protein [Polyangiaceae bacterium]
MSEEVVSIGVDLGGTKIEAAVLKRPRSALTSDEPLSKAGYEVLLRERVATNRDRGYEAIVETAARLILDVAKNAGLDIVKTPVGVGMPGAITRRTQVVKNSNTTCMNGKPFHTDLMKQVGREIVFDNDANCFALAEARLGAARAQVNGVVFGVIMGSGVGGGIVVDGKVWGGPQNIAGEWGHHAVGPWGGKEVGQTPGGTLSPRAVCYCGRTGCLELYTSGVWVEHDYERRAGVKRKLSEIATRSDDPHAKAALEELVEAFGRGLANVINILDPSAVVLGGGVSNLDLLYKEGVARVKKYVFNDELETPIVRHMLGDSAGVLGAALLDGG